MANFLYEFQEFQELKKKKAGDSSFCGEDKKNWREKNKAPFTTFIFPAAS